MLAPMLSAARTTYLPIVSLVDQFAAYARGMLAGSLAEDFLRQHVSRPGRVEPRDAATALCRRLPDAEAELFSPLSARIRGAFVQARAALALQAGRQEMAVALWQARLARPLAALRASLERDND